jgi:hypothetical protein
MRDLRNLFWIQIAPGVSNVMLGLPLQARSSCKPVAGCRFITRRAMNRQSVGKFSQHCRENLKSPYFWQNYVFFAVRRLFAFAVWL